MSEAFMTASARLRQKLERRREQKASTDALQRIPFVLSQDVSDRIQALAAQREKLEDRLAYLQDLSIERDPDDPDTDKRATGEDLSDLGQDTTATEAELERVAEDLEQAVAEAQDDTVQLLFRRVDGAEYERLLIKSGGALVETDMQAAITFQNALTAAAFVRVELADGEDGGMRTWKEFVVAANPDFGEIDPIRALVYANNRRGGNSVPFSSMPSRKTRIS